jgi:hypothetical protein
MDYQGVLGLGETGKSKKKKTMAFNVSYFYLRSKQN